MIFATTPPSASAYSSDSEVPPATRTSSTPRRTGEPRYPPPGSRNTTAANPAKPTSAAPSTTAARRPPGSAARDTTETATAITVPRVNTPNATPRRPYPTVRDTSAAPTTNAVPATPVAAPATTTTGNQSDSPNPTTAPAARSRRTIWLPPWIADCGGACMFAVLKVKDRRERH